MVNINDRIGNYVLTEEINSGGFGNVYKARHIVFDDDPPVAIKVLHPHLIALQQHQQFFLEARLLKKLRHRYILPLLDAGVYERALYIITEYAALGSLHERLQRRNGTPFPIEEAVTILAQVGEALEHAHQQKVTHCDLKPENILFNAQGEALLADFGLATVMNSTSMVYTDSVVGTFAYMAPEQFRGDISKESDQYSLGCIAYELFTGRKPFTVPPVNPLILGELWKYKHNEEVPVAPTQINPALPTYIEQAILKAMAKDRRQRYPDMMAFVAALQSPPKPKRTRDQWYNEGAAHYKAKRYPEALAAFDQAILVDPTYANSYTYRGATLRELLRFEEAIAAYEEAMKRAPHDAIPYNNKGTALYLLKRYEEAIKMYDESIKRDAAYAIPHEGKGSSLQELKRYDEAIASYEEAIKRDPAWWQPYNGKGNALKALKRYDEALKAYEEAIKRDGTQAFPYNGRGAALHMLKRYDEALKAYEEAMTRDPNYAHPHYNKGLIMNIFNRPKEAEVAFARAKELGLG